MTKRIFFILINLLYFHLASATGWLVIGTIANKSAKDIDKTITICYDANHNLYFPSRIFDVDHIEDEYVVYKLYSVYIDSCSAPQIKTVFVKIPEKFKGTCCSVSSEKLVYSFQSDKREILVSVSTMEKDTLKKYIRSELSTHLHHSMLPYQVPRCLPTMDNRYMGVIQSCSYTMYYYNFKRRQKEKLENVLSSFIGASPI